MFTLSYTNRQGKSVYWPRGHYHSTPLLSKAKTWKTADGAEKARIAALPLTDASCPWAVLPL